MKFRSELLMLSFKFQKFMLSVLRYSLSVLLFVFKHLDHVLAKQNYYCV